MTKHLLANGWSVIGIDAITNYYDINLKKSRHDILKCYKNFHAYEGFIQNNNLLEEIYKNHKPNLIIHLAAQAGVRYSMENPTSYFESNLLGTFCILEFVKKHRPDHFIMASTSAVYGNNKKIPFSENQKCDTPISFYAATKKSNEVMAHSYSHLYQIPTTVLRFFTVYGPWGRPDMALFHFTKNILSGNEIDIYNYGNMKRDFTNIDDIVQSINLLIDIVPSKPDQRNSKLKLDSISDTAPYRVINIGSSKPTNLMSFISELEKSLGLKAEKNFLEMQDGDLKETSSNTDLLFSLTGFRAKKKIEEGIPEFVNWYKSYYN